MLGKLKIRLVGLGANDMAEGHKKNILALVWQLVHLHYLQLLGSKIGRNLSRGTTKLTRMLQSEHLSTQASQQAGTNQALLRHRTTHH